jgi:hypothetical protein
MQSVTDSATGTTGQCGCGPYASQKSTLYQNTESENNNNSKKHVSHCCEIDEVDNRLAVEIIRFRGCHFARNDGNDVARKNTSHPPDPPATSLDSSAGPTRGGAAGRAALPGELR